MWRDSFEQAVGIVDPHTLDEQLRYLEEKVVPQNQVLVVLDESGARVIAFMASTRTAIDQLYVHVAHQRKGIGSMLVDLAKRRSDGGLRLFTFKANEGLSDFTSDMDSR